MYPLSNHFGTGRGRPFLRRSILGHGCFWSDASPLFSMFFTRCQHVRCQHVRHAVLLKLGSHDILAQIHLRTVNPNVRAPEQASLFGGCYSVSFSVFLHRIGLRVRDLGQLRLAVVFILGASKARTARHQAAWDPPSLPATPARLPRLLRRPRRVPRRAVPRRRTAARYSAATSGRMRGAPGLRRRRGAN